MLKNKINIVLLILFLGSIMPCSILSQYLTVDEAVNTGIQKNPRLKAAELNIKKQEALKLKSVNIPKPQFFIEFEGIKGGLNNFESRKIGVMQELEFPSSYFLRSDIQNSEITVARANRDMVLNELKHEIKRNYLGLLLQTGLLEEAKANLRVYEDFLFAAQKKYDAGATSNLEVLSAKVNRVKFENEIRDTESQMNIYKAELKRLMNTESDFIPGDELKFSEIQIRIEDLLTAAEKNNPELIAVKFQKNKFADKISLTRSEMLPDLSLKYYNQKNGSQSGYWGFEIGIGVPLWFWWQPSGSIKEADLEYKIAVSDEIALKRKIETEVKRSYGEYLSNARQLDFLTTDVVNEGNEILRQAKTSYMEGSIDYVEMLQALTVSYDLKVQYLNILYALNSAVNDLEMLVSGPLK